MLRHVYKQWSSVVSAHRSRRPSRTIHHVSRRYATTTDSDRFVGRVGTVVHNFILKKEKKIPELHLTALQLEHGPTGAQYLHVAREDPNNLFSINFKTLPYDDTGLPHILEHVTLCGSERYPVRDPFFKMTPRSMANFMNAFTSADYTSFPFATTNKQDFQNLSSVYLDSTFRPLLKKSDFLQEGWRLGPEPPNAEASRDTLQFKGVVYNEMKGQMSDASYLYYVRFREQMFPSLHNSGGDPDKMIGLTHDNLVEFSRQHYHPSNARFFSYGNLELSDQLKLVDSSLDGFGKRPINNARVNPRDLATGPIHVHATGPVDPMQSPDRQSKSSLSWQICSTTDLVETFSFSVATSLLMNGYGSPLYQGLIEPGLGSNFSAITGFDTSNYTSIYSIGLDGMKAEDVPQLEHKVKQILREKAHEAFQPSKVNGLLHQLEIALKHKTASFGIGLLEKVLPAWFNGTDPVDSLKWNEVVNAFKKRLEEPDFLSNMVRKYLDNDRHLVFTMTSTASYRTDGELQESKNRENVLTQLDEASVDPRRTLQTLRQQEIDLLHEQENSKDANLETLPSLHADDISRQMERRPVQMQQTGDSNVLLRETETNGITYVQAKHEIEGLGSELRELLPLFSELLLRLGTMDKTVGELETAILLKTGGISVSPFVRQDVREPSKYSEGLNISSYALNGNVSAMLDLMRTVVCEIDFTTPAAMSAVRELLESKVAGALDSVVGSGHEYAILAASAALSPSGLVREQLTGLTQIDACAKLLRRVQSQPETLYDVIDKLRTIQKLSISNSPRLSFRLVCEKAATAPNMRLLSTFKSSLPNLHILPPQRSSAVDSQIQPRRILFNIDSLVSYGATALRTASYHSTSTAPLIVLGQLLTHNYMHPIIREKGGAYGASASASSISSLFSMSSYRDPKPQNSLNTMAQAGVYARDKQWTPRELEEGKLAVFQQIDAPTSVMSDGSKQFMYGITEEQDQALRERLLDVTREDVQAVAEKYLVNPLPESKAACVIGSAKGWLDHEWDIQSFKPAETQVP